MMTDANTALTHCLRAAMIGSAWLTSRGMALVAVRIVAEEAD